MHFGSDNQAGASPQVLATVAQANEGYAHSYGDDEWTQRAEQMLRDVFERDLDAFFVATGTAANSLALACLTQPWQCVLCHEHAHIVNDESTAPEFFSGGARLIGISQGDGKLTPEHLQHFFSLASNDIPHSPRPSALSVTQITEDGLVYTAAELSKLCGEAHDKGLKVHMDGARFANAVAALGCAPADVTWKAGVDVLCLGATKNGALAAEVILCFDRTLAQSLMHRRKRAGHLLSKNRFVAAQFVGWFTDGHWLALARRANAAAHRLATALTAIPSIRLAWPAGGNELFVVMPGSLMKYLIENGAVFHQWPVHALPRGMVLAPDEAYVRLVTSFVTSDKDLDLFCELARSHR